MDLADTIVALSSAAGSGGRAVVRLSGPAAGAIARQVFSPCPEPWPAQRRCFTGSLRLSGIDAPLPASLLYWPPPRTYTGQELVELHCVACPPLIDLLSADLLRHGGRAARPGEFTLRAFLAGKLDLPRAEAVLGVIEAGSRDQLRQALAQLAGGLTRPLDGLRDDLLNLLADLEAGLDFADEDIQFVDRADLLRRLAAAQAGLTEARRQLAERALADRPFRVVLAGAANAGKSSLFNALTGGQALVSPIPGTTRDYLSCRLDLAGVTVELIDCAGWHDDRPAGDSIDARAEALSREQREQADLVLACVPADRPLDEAAWPATAIVVRTKGDLAPDTPGLVTSVVTRSGLADLRGRIADRARSRQTAPLAPSLARCRHHIDAALDHLQQAHDLASCDDPVELVALEARGALDQLGELVGAVYTDDLLDRVFSRFCIGK